MASSRSYHLQCPHCKHCGCPKHGSTTMTAGVSLQVKGNTSYLLISCFYSSWISTKCQSKQFSSVQFSSVQWLSCVRLCDPMNRSSPGLPVHHQLLEFTQTLSIESVMPSSHLILCRPFSSCPQSLPASESFPMSQLFA